MIDTTTPTLLDLELRRSNGHVIPLVGTAEAWRHLEHCGELPAGTRIDAHEATLDDVLRAATAAGYKAIRIHQAGWKPLAPPSPEPEPRAAVATAADEGPAKGGQAAQLRKVRHHLLQALAHLDAENYERMRPHLARAAQITIEHGA